MTHSAMAFDNPVKSVGSHFLFNIRICEVGHVLSPLLQAKGGRQIIVLLNWFDGTVCHTNQYPGCLSIDFRALQDEGLNDPLADCSPQIFNRKFSKKLAKTSLIIFLGL
jgi:hypothetical protein